MTDDDGLDRAMSSKQGNMKYSRLETGLEVIVTNVQEERLETNDKKREWKSKLT